jgi:NB-ARC domain
MTGPAAADERQISVQRDEGIVSSCDNAVNTLVRLPERISQPAEEAYCPPGLSNLPARPGLFVGRAGALAELDSGRPVHGVVAQVVVGPAGIGKSALAARWAARRSDCSPVWWITADARATVGAGLASLASALEPFLPTVLPVTALAERAVTWLAARTGWLLVLDDVQDPGDVAALLARVQGGRFLITSRRVSGWHGIAAPICLGMLAEDEAVALLHSILRDARVSVTDGAAEMCRELGCLPLSIERAGAYIAEAAVSPRAYLSLLSQYPAAMRAAASEGWRPGLAEGQS